MKWKTGYEIASNSNEGIAAFKVSRAIIGQGYVSPMEFIWKGHAVLKHGDCIYDPSYGQIYGGTLSTLNQSFLGVLDSVGIQRPMGIDEPNDHEEAYESLITVTVDNLSVLASRNIFYLTPSF